MKTTLLTAISAALIFSSIETNAQNITANFSATNVCFNNLNCFTDLSTSSNGPIISWNWNFGEPGPNNSSNLQNPCHTYNSTGTFTVCLVVTNSNNDVDTTCSLVTVNPLPVANFIATTVCVGFPTCFTDLSTISSGNIIAWSWNFGDPASGPNNISFVQNPCHIFTSAGVFNVILTVTSDSGCQSTTILPVIVNPLPVAAFTANDVCLNSPTFFTDQSSGAVQWNWDFGDGNTSTQQNPMHTYFGYGNYIVTLVVTSTTGCSDTVADTITVYPLPIVNFKSDTVCVGDATSFSDLSFIPSGNITNWNWNFGDPPSGANNISAQQNPTHIFPSSGSFNVTLTATSDKNCQSTVILSVLVHPLPGAAFSPSINGDTVNFNDLSFGGAVQWTWDFGDGNFSTVQYPTHTYTTAGTYIVCLIVTSQYGCIDTTCNTIIILSVDENDISSHINISPNPSSGNVFVDFGTKNFGKAAVSFSDIIGQTLFETNIPASGKQTLDVSAFSKGIYFLKLKTDSGVATKKIVIAK